VLIIAEDIEAGCLITRRGDGIYRCNSDESPIGAALKDVKAGTPWIDGEAVMYEKAKAILNILVHYANS